MRPARSLTVTDNITGTSLSLRLITDVAASTATLALSVSNIVSINIRSTPPSTNASICSKYAS